MVVPVGRVVELTVVSPDVIHSWWVPALGGKIDAIPGRTNHTWFKAQKLGRYEVRCAELCGLEHAHMTGWVDVVTPAAVRGLPRSAHRRVEQPLGQEIFEGVCATVPRPRRPGRLRPEARGQRARRRPEGARADSSATARTRCRPVGATWNDATMKAATDYLKERFGGG